MKTSICLPTLLATILCVGPALAEKPADQARETEVALEARSQALADATETAQREVERNLKRVEREIRVAQDQTGKALAAAGPTIKRAFGASFVNTPEPPLVVATSKLDATALAELREDLNVMTKLVSDAVADEREDGPGHAMGIVVKWLPGGGGNNNLYIEGAGAIIQASVRFPLKPPQKEETKPAAETPKNSAWESARRELYGGKRDNDSEIVLPPDKREEYSAERVESMKKAILKALANANNFRRLGEKETVTVVVRNRNSNPAKFVMFDSWDERGRGKVKSSADDDSTMTVRVKKSDADALAAGKIKEEEFQKRAQVAIY